MSLPIRRGEGGREAWEGPLWSPAGVVGTDPYSNLHLSPIVLCLMYRALAAPEGIYSYPYLHYVTYLDIGNTGWYQQW